MEDQRNILRDEKPFGYKELKDSKLQITFRGKPIMIIQGKEYRKFRTVLEREDEYGIQLFLAKITGQFKHGNERKKR
ncbi:MAG: hypothetical protein JXR86_01585 [Spirochaetales bacterium]|nr:hypothetical protein [Spirochaetales bacterium]